MRKLIEESVNNHKSVLNSLPINYSVIEEIASLLISSLKNKGKILFLGNGGSAADAQHLAAEFVGRFKKDRYPLAAIALTTNTSILTAVGNDFSFEEIFSRQIEALININDIVIGISTSGKSKNIIKAIQTARQLGVKTVGLLGKDGGDLSAIVDVPLIINSYDTPRVQEMHILIGHIICNIVETSIYPNKG